MREQVKVGVIGTSWWADVMYLPILSNYERAALTAICGRNRERAEEMAAKYAVPQVYTDYRQMIDEAQLEAIIVSTPDDTHYEMVLAALDAGLHVICEKPAALNADQAKEMADKAEAAGVKHMVYYTWRWLPTHTYLKQLLDEGYLGRLFHGSLRFIGGTARTNQYGWRFDGDRANGILGDLGSHMIDLARWYLGEISSVSAALSECYERQHEDGRPVRPANDAALLNVSFANGATATIQASAVAHLAERGMQQEVNLYGARGTLETRLNLGEPEYCLLSALSDDERFTELDLPKALLRGITDEDPFGMFKAQPVGVRLFIDCILEDKAAEPNLHDGFKTQQVIDAALLSHQSGQRVMIT